MLCALPSLPVSSAIFLGLFKCAGEPLAPLWVKQWVSPRSAALNAYTSCHTAGPEQPMAGMVRGSPGIQVTVPMSCRVRENKCPLFFSGYDSKCPAGSIHYQVAHILVPGTVMWGSEGDLIPPRHKNQGLVKIGATWCQWTSLSWVCLVGLSRLLQGGDWRSFQMEQVGLRVGGPDWSLHCSLCSEAAPVASLHQDTEAAPCATSLC